MKPNVIDKKVTTSPSILAQIIRKSLIIYLLSAVSVPAICFIFGWRSLDNMGTGFMYGALGLVLFVALILAGNTVPAQLSKLSIPKYSPPHLRSHQEAECDGSLHGDGRTIFFLAILICGALLFVTGICLKMF
jgi:hypothetical protein